LVKNMILRQQKWSKMMIITCNSHL
jgi:hypothetical protein